MHFEPEGIVTRAIDIRGRHEGQLAGVDVSPGNHLVEGDVAAVILQGPGAFQGGNLHLAEAVGVHIGKVKVSGSEGIGGVFIGGNRVIACRGGVLDGADIDSHLIGRGAVLGAVMDLEPEGIVTRAIGIGGRSEGQLAGVDVGFSNHLVGGHIRAVTAQSARGFQGCNLYLSQAVPVDIGKVEVGSGKGVRGILIGGDRAACCGGGVLDGGDIHGYLIF